MTHDVNQNNIVVCSLDISDSTDIGHAHLHLENAFVDTYFIKYSLNFVHTWK